MELTQEQIETAAKTFENNFKMRFVTSISDFHAAIRAIAPLLQLPWELPTSSEVDAVMLTPLANEPWTQREKIINWMRRFVADRNAALAPKPADPRREKVERAIEAIKEYHRGQNLSSSTLSTQEVADRILAALDAKD
jgi:hypothetical protein